MATRRMSARLAHSIAVLPAMALLLLAGCGSRFSLTDAVVGVLDTETELRLRCDELDAALERPVDGGPAARRLSELAAVDSAAAWQALRAVVPLPAACDVLGDPQVRVTSDAMRSIVQGLTVPGAEEVRPRVRACHDALEAWGTDWAAGIDGAGAGERARYARALGRVLERAGVARPSDLVTASHHVAATLDFSSPFVFLVVRVASTADDHVASVAQSVPFASAIVKASLQRVAAELFAIAAEYALRRIEARRALRVSTVGSARAACRFLGADARLSPVARAALQRMVLRVSLYDADRLADYRHISNACGQSSAGEGRWNRSCRRVFDASGLGDTLDLSASDVAGAWVPALDGPMERAMRSHAEAESADADDAAPVVSDASLSIALDLCADNARGCNPEELAWLGGLAAREGIGPDDPAARESLHAALVDSMRQLPELTRSLEDLEEQLSRIETATARIQATVGDYRDGQSSLLDRMARMERSMASMDLALQSLASCRDEQDRVVRARLRFLDGLGFAVGANPGTATFDEQCLAAPERAPDDPCPSSSYCLSDASLFVEVSRDFVCTLTTLRFEPKVSYAEQYEPCRWEIPQEATRAALARFGERLATRLNVRLFDVFAFRGVADRQAPRRECRASIEAGGPSIAAFTSLVPNRQLALLRAWEVALHLHGGRLDPTELAAAIQRGSLDGVEDLACDPREPWCRRVEVLPRGDSAATLFQNVPDLAGRRCGR